MRDCVRQWWPLVAGALATTGLLLGAYLGLARGSGASTAQADRQQVPRNDALPVKAVPDRGTRAEPMSTYTTWFEPGEPRVRNIALAAEMLDGHVVAPGTTFSFNDVVGPRTESRGYVPAPAIMGSRLVNDVGGGVCQVSSTLFNAVFRAGLDIRKARAHSMYMPEYPEGREAAVSYPGLDFTWRNDTRRPVRIEVVHGASSLTVNLWGERRYQVRSRSSERYGVTPFGTGSGRGWDCVPTRGRNGFEIDVWRTLLRDGRQVRREKFHTEYRPQPKVTCLE
ncbi:VanW family protein [Actinomadura pelletieri]|uniref:VanW family protein n=1 Tax=Actinomadura pelletieri TaxID=111805 RepID=UPI000EAE075E|nr:VanW family protein [Actinomadura pelletieri]